MPVRALLLAVAALVVAGLVYVGGQKLLAAQPAAAATSGPPAVKVLVAVHSITAGVPIAEADVAWRAWPAASLDASYVRDGETIGNAAGRIARVSYAPGQPLSRDTLVRQGEAGALALVIAPGMRAVSLTVNAASGVSGLIMPGDHVDVVLTHSVPRRPDATFEHHAAVTLIRDRRVLAIEQKLGVKNDAITAVGVAANPIEPRTASLEVAPREAEMLDLGAEMGKLSLVLRPFQRDRGTAPAASPPTRDVDLDTLFAGGAPARPTAPPLVAAAAPVRPAGPKVFHGSQADAGAAR